MSTPNSPPNSRVTAFSSHAIAMIASAVLAAVGTYYATKYASIATSDNDAATHYIDVLQTPENNVTSFFKIPGVTLSLKDRTGAPVEALSEVKIDLENFGERDIGPVDLQIDATAVGGVTPVLQTLRISNASVEDRDAENNLKSQTTGDNTLSISIPIKSVNRTEGFTPARTILLYFKGPVAPNTTVAANAEGVVTRPYAPQHYFDTQRAHQSFTELYADRIATIAIVVLFSLWSAWIILSSRKRESQNFVSCLSVTEKALQGLPVQPMTPAQQTEAARDVVFSIWKEIYARTPKFARWLSITPDRSKL